MKYSNVVLNDNNFDEELDKLCEFAMIPLDSYNTFVDKLEGFILQLNNDKEEWINVWGSFPNKGSDYKQANQKGQLAYEFGNGFIILDYDVLL